MNTPLNPAKLLATALVAVAAAATLTSAPAQADTKPVTIQLKKSDVVVGQTTKITGKAKPNGAKTVVLQKKLEGRSTWKKESSTRIAASGWYSFRVEPTSITSRKYRVVQAGTGMSKAVTLTPYDWYPLASIDPRAAESFGAKKGSVKIDGEVYRRTLVGSEYSQTGSVDWNLRGDCLRLKATYGITDESDLDVSSAISVVSDGTATEVGSFALREATTSVTDLTGVFRLGFSYVTTDPSRVNTYDPWGAFPVVANPQVLCHF